MKSALTLLAVVTLSQRRSCTNSRKRTEIRCRRHQPAARTGTTNQPTMTGGVLRGGRYDLRNATMLDLIATA
jgi:hypothetical protein